MNLSFTVGFISGLMTREIFMVARKGLKPVAKNLMKATHLTYQRGVEEIARISESVEDLFAEVVSENRKFRDQSLTHTKKKKDQKEIKENREHKKNLTEEGTHATVH